MVLGIKPKISILMGIIIGLADIYWIYTSYFSALWVGLGAVIFIADLIWLWVDISLGKHG
ncbi:MAG: hypothetical protein QW091_02620 [Candidatus Micrarchaeaceae archaeon]